MDQTATELKSLRESIGLSKKQLAEVSGCTRVTIDRAEDIARGSKPETTEKLKGVLTACQKIGLKHIFSRYPELYDAFHGLAMYHKRTDEEELKIAIEAYLVICAALGV